MAETEVAFYKDLLEQAFLALDAIAKISIERRSWCSSKTMADAPGPTVIMGWPDTESPTELCVMHVRAARKVLKEWQEYEDRKDAE